jgi:hypothetical protein
MFNYLPVYLDVHTLPYSSRYPIVGQTQIQMQLLQNMSWSSHIDTVCIALTVHSLSLLSCWDLLGSSIAKTESILIYISFNKGLFIWGEPGIPSWPDLDEIPPYVCYYFLLNFMLRLYGNRAGPLREILPRLTRDLVIWAMNFPYERNWNATHHANSYNH